MPTYDYVCDACGHRVEVIHGVYGHGPTECPNCHARAMRKAISAPAVLYRGSGWAKKDRSSSLRAKASEKTESTDKAGSSEKAAGSTETGTVTASTESKGGSGSGTGTGSGSDSGSAKGASSRSGSRSAPSAAERD